ncbi:MAG: histidine kinase [Bacillota bacterium]|nr:histidine kinase [Bacillota bacterium]
MQSAQEPQNTEKRQNETAESQAAALLRQLQPHFLFNALNAIQHFCAGNPRAQELVLDFSHYLRGNMASLTEPGPIPFTQELKHLRYYLNIQAVRYPNVRVSLDPEAADFSLPALSLQPLVESAIRRSAAGPAESSIVRISSREGTREFTVCVEDGGPVCVSAAETGPETPSPEISDLRSRLAAMCGGRLETEIRPGAGTKNTIYIPKEAQQ